MVHIILFVLKILGWIVLVILGLFLLLSLTVLLAGFRYRGKLKCMGPIDTLDIGLEFSWLFHLVKGRFLYENGNMKWRLRVAWKNFPADRKANTAYKTTTEQEVVKTEEKEEHTEEKRHKEQKEKASRPEISDEFKEANYRKAKKDKKETGEFSADKKENHKIEYTFRKICDTIKALKAKKEHVLDFVRTDVHRSALKKSIKELKRLGSFLKPDVLEVELKFGFSDPAVTGYTLGGLSMIYPFIGEHVRLEPDFENKILKGQAYVRGKIRGIYPVIFLWNMLCDKQVRRTIADIRSFQL